MNYTNSPEFKAQDAKLMKAGFMSFCKNGIEGFYKGITDKPFVIDKSRGWSIHYGFLNSFYPNPKIIVTVRDLRAIFASMEKNFRKNQDKDSGIIDHSQMIGTTTEKRIDVWANSQPVGLAIERLYQILKEGTAKNMLFIKFEDLTANPATELKRVYEFLELPYFNHDFNNVEQITVEDDNVYGMYGDHTIKKEVKPLPIDYNKILGKEACAWIKQNYKWFYDEFNYF
jgi:sulfotransferase